MIQQPFETSVDVTRALLWQYEEAAKLRAIVEAKQRWYDAFQAQFWNDWYTSVFNLKTCNWFGCNIWAIILGLPQELVKPETKTPWGFGGGRQNFDNGNFATVVPSFQLTLDEARRVLRMRYYYLISNGTVPFINAALKDVFGDLGVAWVEDNQDMTMTYQFGFVLSNDLKITLNNYDILPRPAGVFVPPL